MAKQIDTGCYITAPIGIGAKSGDPILIGEGLTGVAEADADASGNGVLSTEGTYELSVKGVNGGGNSAVAIGDKIYFVTGDTPVLSKKATGVFFGYARATVTSGATATIKVLKA